MRMIFEIKKEPAPGRAHPEIIEDRNKADQRGYYRNYTVLVGGKIFGIKRDQQETNSPGQDVGNGINGTFFPY